MKKILIILSFFTAAIKAMDANALFNIAIKENLTNAAQALIPVDADADVKNNRIKKFERVLKTKYVAPAQGGGIPSNLKASSDKIDQLIKSANTPQGYLEAFKTIVTETGKPAIDGLKAKGVSASDINGVLAQLKA